jgi:threonine synthase
VRAFAGQPLGYDIGDDRLSIWRFHERLPEIEPQHRVTLGEGNTPLVASRAIGRSLGLDNLYFKLESCNPTGSFKDRFAAVALSDLLSAGSTLCLGTSSGNTGAALAAYSAAAGIRCLLAIVDTAPQGKLTQMLAYGAELYRIRGFGTEPRITSEIVGGLSDLASERGTAVQISAFKYSPIGMSGVCTIAWELEEQLPDGIEHVFTPSGGGGLTIAVARGFAAGNSATAVHCVQPSGNDTIAGRLRGGHDSAVDCQSETTVSGLQVASVIDGHETLVDCRASGGTGWLVSDSQTFEMQARLAAEEGIFCEPAGAVAVAGLAQAVSESRVQKGDTIVCLVTGSGFKDISSVESMIAGREAALLDNFSQFVQRV